ncbi:MAG: hypothetical protein OEZ13_10950 [Spirochaetia bacterium]|nr:hypothetical protein [Spirochaetia bacterium]
MKNTIIRKLILITLLSWLTCDNDGGVVYHYNSVEYNYFAIGMQNNEEPYYLFADSPANVKYSTNVIDITKTDIQTYIGGGNLMMRVSYYIDIDREKTGCTESEVHYILKAYDNDNLMNSTSEIIDVGSGWMTFLPNFTDPTYNTAETHVYRLEFYECEGHCEFDAYSLIKDKFGEITVTLNYTP